MDFPFLLSLGYLLYGIAGLLGFQKIPAVHQDRPWTKSYTRWQAVSWILTAMPLLVYSFYLSGQKNACSFGQRLVILMLAFVPTMVFEFIRCRKFSRLLKAEKQQETVDRDGGRQ